MLLVSWGILWKLAAVILLLNIIGAIITVFREKRDIAATWAWLLVLIFLPIIGFVIYSFIGRQLPQKKLDQIQAHEEKEIKEAIQAQKNFVDERQLSADRITDDEYRMVKLFMNEDNAFLARKNKVEIFTDGTELFDQMIADFQAAQDSILIEFYTYYSDEIGQQILRVLEQKAAEGVEVRVLYDSWGSMGTKRSFFDQLRHNGGFAEPFLGVKSNLFDFRLNFRNHRKVVVVDSEIGYIGGFNIGDQYLGRDAKFGYWRDTHLRVQGSVISLVSRFIRDWNVTSQRNQITEYGQYIKTPTVEGPTSMQIVSSSPDNDEQKIKLGYLKLINSAVDQLWIQSPYLIPDDSVLDALKVSVKSGVDVRIMIPNKPDHAFVYRASQYYAHELADAGVKIYFYENGFIHAKTMVVDGRMASVGSANMDFRSFKLNFEINSFLYDSELAQELERIYRADIEKSRLMTSKDFQDQSLWLRIKQTGSRLLSPVL